MATRDVSVDFSREFKGVLDTGVTQATVGSAPGELLPYDMLFAALASCLYATFLDIVNKKKIDFESAKVTVSGAKRDEVPTFLKEVHVHYTIKGSDNEKALKRSAMLAAKYCSVYQTISKVADMSWDLECEL
jgi:putative redox protein